MFYLYLYNCTCAFRPSLDPTTLKPKLTTGAASWQSPDTVLFLSWFWGFILSLVRSTATCQLKPVKLYRCKSLVPQIPLLLLKS